VVVHGHHGDPAKRGPSVMSYDVFGRVLREGMTRGSTGAGRVASRWRTYRTHHTPPRERSHHPRVTVRNGSGPNQRATTVAAVRPRPSVALPSAPWAA
jgi:hypothetical protein